MLGTTSHMPFIAAVADRADRVFPFFMGTWLVLAVVSFLLFYRGGDADRKRRLFPPFTVGVAILFLGFVALMGWPPSMLVLMAPVVGLITFLNLRNTQFCDSCGRVVPTRGFSRPKYCPRCGAALRAG